MIYALDSNIISYFLEKDAKIRERLTTETNTGNQFIMSTIVYFEVERWLLEKGAVKKHAEFKRMCHDIPPEEFNLDVWDTAAKLYVQIRKKGQPIDNVDLMIAAFCIANNYTLVTNNTRHFERINGLEFVNWKGEA
jgi:tRNA(fMet)-specific endonuclease VapC